MLLFDCGPWMASKDGDPSAFALMQRHYSFQRYADGRRDDPTNRARRLFVGPGEKLVLMNPECTALFAWRRFIDDSGFVGVCCTVFRNESPVRASTLILEAEQIAWRRWPGERLYTTVDPVEVRGDCPGYCFRRAGWRHCADTVDGRLMYFDKWPN